MSTDEDRIIVCGGGLAGLSAGITALESGARVLLLEKAPELGGTTKLSGGLLWTFADYEVARAKVPHGDPALQWLVFETIDESRDWLAAQGVKLGPEEHGVLVHGRGKSVDPAGMIDVLAGRFAELGGELRLETGMHSLLTSDGVVRGVRALHAGRSKDYPARAVVLATGGFQGNQELLARYAVPDAGNLALRASFWSTGDGLIAAMAAGAAASPGMGNLYGHALAAPPARFARRQLRDASQYHGCVSVALNLRGERFTDETGGTGDEAVNQHLASQPEGRGVYVVDDTVMDVTPIQGRPAVVRAILERTRALGGTVFEAATLEGLCEQFAAVGIPPRRALASLLEFNAAMQDRAEDAFPPRRDRRHPLVKPPFRATHVKAAITITQGGLAVDERTRVLWRAGSTSAFADVPVDRAYADTSGPVTRIGEDYRQMPMAGLYAAGSDVGNVSHFGYMGGLATALTTGRMAGREAAAWAGAPAGG